MKKSSLILLAALMSTIPAAASSTELFSKENNRKEYEPEPAREIDTGRQLFVDDWVIAETDLERVWHHPVKYSGNPVLKPETEWENPADGNPVALPKGGGVWWNPEKEVFEMWYEGGWLRNVCYATSRDGIHWDRPTLDVVPGTNIVLPTDNPAFRPDSWSVVRDPWAAKPEERYKMVLHRPWVSPGSTQDGACFISPDGIHWNPVFPLPASGDRSTLYYNPFREEWVFSIRSSWLSKDNLVRTRSFYALNDFMDGPEWYSYFGYGDLQHEEYKVNHWMQADENDLTDPKVPGLSATQLYCFDAVAYESIMLGMAEILIGPDNNECEMVGMPKITDLKFAFSRDGRNFFRPDREAAIASERWDSGKWDTGYVQSASSICVVMGDELWFYYGGFSGSPEKANSYPGERLWYINNGMYSGGATGIAKLRRDGFASLSGSGEIVTRPVTFSGNCLYVNVNASQGSIAAELLDEKGNVIDGFSAKDSRIRKIDSTKQRITWKKHPKIELTKYNAYRIRFILENADLYSFWMSDESGASGGYLAGGGPGYASLKDNLPKRQEIAAKIFTPDREHSKDNRLMEGIPSIAVSPGGRMWATWYASKTQFEDEYNYLILSSSTDGGETWEEKLIADPDGDGPRRTFDPEIWMAPDGKLHWTWTDRSGAAYCRPDDDQLWMADLDPETGELIGEPRVIGRGVMMNKPAFLSDGTWILPSSHWEENPSSCVYASTDGGKTFQYRGGARLPVDHRFCDEHTVLEKRDGGLKVYIRTFYGNDNCLWEADSDDGGYTWSKPVPCRAGNVCSRTLVMKLENGDWVMVKHGQYSRILNERSHMTALVSRDDGKTWWGGLLLDERSRCSYPDGVQLPDGSIAVISDYDRLGDREVSFVRFREEDIIAGAPEPKRVIISSASAEETGLALEDIYCRDPFIVADQSTGTYYLYRSSTTAEGLGGVEAFTSRDLKSWHGPERVFTVPADNFITGRVWAPEVHHYKGAWYLFATLNSDRKWSESVDGWPDFTYRGTQVFRADSPAGPFLPLSKKLTTPQDFMALDGTFWEEDGKPWMVFCHEWVQVVDGTFEAMPLKSDLSAAAGSPKLLFKASDAAWTTGGSWLTGADGSRRKSYVSDGNFLYRTSGGKLLLLWSSFKDGQYCVAISRSVSGRLKGPWTCDPEPIFEDDGGHPMVFRDFKGGLNLVFHQPNSGHSHPVILPVEDNGETLIIKH